MPPSSRRISPRCAAGRSAAARSAIAVSGTSNSSATAAAASTFARLPRPTSGVVISTAPRGVVMRAAIPSTPRSATAVARTSASRSMPKVVMRPANFPVRPATRSSSALATSSVDGEAPSKISALASAIASTDRKKPTCASPTLVHTRTSGSAIPTSVLISPAWFIPSSTTAMSGRLRSSISDSGRPMWLFRFPRLRTTRYCDARNAPVTSLVVVLPALPVIATTLVPDSRRTVRASHCSADVVSSTSITTGTTGEFPPAIVPGRRPRGITSPAAPAATAASANSAPSNRSPRIAMNNWPGAIVRVSIDTP